MRKNMLHSSEGFSLQTHNSRVDFPADAAHQERVRCNPILCQHLLRVGVTFLEISSDYRAEEDFCSTTDSPRCRAMYWSYIQA
jgi:hypothetical protein